MEGIPTNLPDLEEPFPICLLTKVTKIPIGTIGGVIPSRVA